MATIIIPASSAVAANELYPPCCTNDRRNHFLFHHISNEQHRTKRKIANHLFAMSAICCATNKPHTKRVSAVSVMGTTPIEQVWWAHRHKSCGGATLWRLGGCDSVCGARRRTSTPQSSVIAFLIALSTTFCRSVDTSLISETVNDPGTLRVARSLCRDIVQKLSYSSRAPCGLWKPLMEWLFDSALRYDYVRYTLLAKVKYISIINNTI